MQKLSENRFQNEFVARFPGDDSGNLTPRQTPGVLYSKAVPTPVRSPKLLAWSEDLASMLGIAYPDENDVNILAGNLVTPFMYPYAACYAGHQFGNWAGQLGDGRAITLGEWPAKDGQSWEIQLKGAGQTAYSRRGDGRAVLRSSLREYLMSEAMHYLGIPTTRALSLVSTGEPILRDMFYDGHPEYEPGAIVARVSPTFLRFGNYEMLAARKEVEHLTSLIDWTISRYYPHITGEDRLLVWYREVVERTASLMTEWLRVGFVHGVMNTDNMSILGLTIDYGPFSFLDNFDPNFTPNTTDLPGRRYAFGQQASVAYWNLSRLANALAGLVPDVDILVKELEAYQDSFWMKYYQMMGNKLGFDQVHPEDVEMINEFEKFLVSAQPDYTIFFQLLMTVPDSPLEEEQLTRHFQPSLYADLHPAELTALKKLINDYQGRIARNTCSRTESKSKMKWSNPRIILRNYMLQEAIDALSNGQDELFIKLQQAMKEPYSDKFDEFFKLRPEWAVQKAGCSMLSCSS